MDGDAGSDKAIIDDWKNRRRVRGDGRPGRGRGFAEEDDDEYAWRMDDPPPDVIAAWSRQDAREREDKEQQMPLSQNSGTSNVVIGSDDDDDDISLFGPSSPCPSSGPSARKSGARAGRKRKKKSASTQLSAIPAKPIVPTLLANPSKKDLLKGPVSEKQGRVKMAAALADANSRISTLEAHISTILFPAYLGMRQALQAATKSGWDYIGDQGDFIRSLQQGLTDSEERIDELEEKVVAHKSILELTKTRLELTIAKKDSALGIKSAKIEGLTATKKSLEATISMMKAMGKTTAPGPSAEEIILIENTKAQNKIKVNRR